MSIHLWRHRNSSGLWRAQINNNDEINTKENNIMIWDSLFTSLSVEQVACQFPLMLVFDFRRIPDESRICTTAQLHLRWLHYC